MAVGGKKRHNVKVVITHVIALGFATLFDSSFGFSLRPGYAVAIYFLLVTAACRKWFFLLLITLLCVMSSIYAPISFLYGPPNINILISMMESNPAETFEFFSVIPTRLYLYSLLIIVLSVFLILHCSLLNSGRNKITFLLFLIIFLYSPILSVANNKEIDFDFTPVKFIKKIHHSAMLVQQEKDRLKALMNVKTTFAPTSVSDEIDTYILVIGESVRRDFMGAYGFSINNTPFMSLANVIIFNNYISAASSTQTSLSTSFTAHGKPQDNIIRLAQGQNLETWWISNQGSYGNDDSQVSIIGKQTDHPVFIKKGEYDSTHHDDRELLPYIKSALQASSKKKLIVIHLMGSHPNFCSRTNNKYDQFYVNESLSCYGQSIKNTDTLLSDITLEANREHKKWTMLYFADHGLSFIDKDDKNSATFIHGDKTKQNFSVPLFITAYNSTLRIVKKQTYSAMDFLSLYLYWTNSSEASIQQQCNPLTRDDCNNTNVQVLDFSHQRKSFSELIDEPAS